MIDYETIARDNHRGGTEDDVAVFEKRFTDKYGHLKCAELRGFLSGKCNDYAGYAASIVGSMGILPD